MVNEIVVKVKINGDGSDCRFYLRSLFDFLKNSNQFLKIEDYEFFDDNRVIILDDNILIKKGD